MNERSGELITAKVLGPTGSSDDNGSAVSSVALQGYISTKEIIKHIVKAQNILRTYFAKKILENYVMDFLLVFDLFNF